MAIHRFSARALCVTLAVALAACSDSSSFSPRKDTAVAVALPQAARYIVELSTAGPVPSDLAAAIKAEGGRVLRSHAGTGLVLVAGLSAQAAGALRSRAEVHAVAPDVERRFLHEPMALRRATADEVPASVRSRTAHVRGNPLTAPFYTDGTQWNMRQVRADSGWVEAPTQGSGQTVYILDTGVDTNHIELKGHVNTALSTSFAFAPTDTLQQNPLPFWHDVVGHGTFVSSIVTGNADSIASVAPQAQIVMVRVLDDSGSGSDFSIINGIVYATDNGAAIINMSLGGYLDRTSGSFLALGDLYQRVADYATARGTLIVVAAGNEAVNTNTGASPTGSFIDSLNVPAGLHHVISVGATGPVNQVNFDGLAVYSNFGSADVAVFAPGGNSANGGSNADLVIGAGSSFNSICMANRPGEGCYLIGDGTSFASPHVAGEAAVVLSHASSAMTPASLESCLLNSATELNGDRPDITFNFGRIDVLNAIKSSSCQ